MVVKYPWQDIVRQVQNHRDKSTTSVLPPLPDFNVDSLRNVTTIPKQVLSSKEVQITESSAENLVESLGNGTLTSLEVTHAFLRRAALAQKLASSL